MHGVDETHVHRFGRHDQRLGPFAGPEKPDAVQDRAVGHAAGREDDFVAWRQVVGVIDARRIADPHLPHPFDQAVGNLRAVFGLLQLLFQDEARLDFAVQTFHGGGGDHAFGAAAYAHQRVDARPGYGRRDSRRQIAVGDQTYARAGVADVLNEFAVAGAVQNYDR